MKKIFIVIVSICILKMASGQTTLQTVTTTGNTTTNALRITGEANIGTSGSPELVLGFLNTIKSNDTRAFIGWKGDAIANTTTNGQAGALLLQPRTSLADMSIDFATGNTTPLLRMRIAGNGNVSMGDNSLIPTSRLLIKGSGTTNTTSSLLIQNSAAAELFRVLDNGNVGIGVAASGYKLDVNGTVRFQDVMTMSNNMWHKSNDNIPRLYFGTSGRTFFGSVDGYEFRNNADAGLAALTNTGLLGLGTVTPVTKLHLNGNNTTAGAPVIMVQNFIGTGLVGSLRFASGYNAYDSWSGVEAYGTGGADQQDLRFYTTFGARNERMRILQTGEVGIGTTSGSARLNVKGFGATLATASLIIQNSSGTESFRVLDNGSVGIGTSSPGSFKLAVEGKIGARGVKVTMQTPWPDYVFENNYRILPITELEKFIKKEKHLPEVSAASAIEKDGIDLGDFQTVLLKKVEELTLYLIDQNKKLESQGNEINSLKKQLLLLQTK